MRAWGNNKRTYNYACSSLQNNHIITEYLENEGNTNYLIHACDSYTIVRVVNVDIIKKDHLSLELTTGSRIEQVRIHVCKVYHS